MKVLDVSDEELELASMLGDYIVSRRLFIAGLHLQPRVNV